MNKKEQYKSSRFAKIGYEVSSQGDRRFSAYFARLKDGETIEFKYQCRVKGYSSIKEGKGKPPKDTSVDLWEEYLKLWKQWCQENPKSIQELKELLTHFNYTLTDKFATSQVNQARALATILNEMY